MPDEPIKIKQYGHTVEISSEVLGTDDTLDRYMAAYFYQHMAEIRESHMQRIIGDAISPKPYSFKPPTRWERFRSWLGWKVWGLAAKINPDVIDY